MNTFDVIRDVVYDDTPWIILTEADLQRMQSNAESSELKDMLAEHIKGLKAERKANADKLRSVCITVKVPTAEDRTEIRAKAKGIDGLFDREREPLAACERLIKKWDLKNTDGEDVELNHNNIREQMPLCLLDAVYGEIWPRMYPSQARLSFLPQSVA